MFDNVNPYCLDSLVGLSEQRTVLASDDIYDDRGFKLWAKGQPVSHDLQDKLLRRRLRKPLETSLEVEDALSFRDISAAAVEFIERFPHIGRIAGRGALGMLRDLQSFPVPTPLRLLLTAAQVNDPRSFQHTLSTVLVCAGLADRAGMSEHDARLLMVAALLHDIGEIYIKPDYLKSAYRLGPHEWKHVASHPRIGQMLIQEVSTLPSAVALIVGQHHERLDGSGYPNQWARARQHPLSNWLAVADTASAILARADAGAPLRVALALRVVPEEYDRQAVGVMTQALRYSGDAYGGDGDAHCIQRAGDTWRQVVQAARLAASLCREGTEAFVRTLAAATASVLSNLEKSLRATGVVDTEHLCFASSDGELLAEIGLVVRETEWRLRNLARNVHLQAEIHAGGATLGELAGLVAARDTPAATIDAPRAALAAA